MFGRNKLKSWGKLDGVYRRFKKTQMKDLFAADENRADKGETSKSLLSNPL